MKLLILCCLAATSYAQLVRHFGGAVTPIDYANFYGKRDAEADPQLVHHFNGAVTPFYAANYHATVQHLASKGYPLYYGKREAEADPQLLYNAFPFVYGHHLVPALVAHPNGAVVPLEPADVVKARAEHLAAHAAA